MPQNAPIAAAPGHTGIGQLIAVSSLGRLLAHAPQLTMPICFRKQSRGLSLTLFRSSR